MTAKSRISCKHCGELVFKAATVCPHCGCSLKLWREFISITRSIVGIVAFLSTAIAIWFLYDSSLIMHEQLRLQGEARKEDQASSELRDSLTKVHLAKLDDELELWRIALRNQSRSIGVDSTKTHFEVARYLADQRPDVRISKVDGSFVGDTVTLHFNLANEGKAVASDCSLVIDVENLPDHNHLTPNLLRVGDFTITQPRVFPVAILSRSLHDQNILKTSVEYTWKGIEASTYSNIRYFLLGLDSANRKITCHSLTDDQVQDLSK